MYFKLGAIQSSDESWFDNSDQAEHLLETLKFLSNESSVVILDGKWGEGKTSLINRVKQINGDNNKFIFSEYEAWGLDTSDNPALSFLLAFSGSARNTPYLHGLVEHVNNFVTAFSSSMQGVNTFLASRIALSGSRVLKKLVRSTGGNVATLKQVISSKLELAEQKICIVIDDIDRLDAKQMVSLLKVLKTVGDIKNIVYLLPADYRKMKEKILSTPEYKSDDQIMEKLVSKIVKYNPPSNDELKLYLLRSVSGVLQQYYNIGDQIHSVKSERIFRSLITNEQLTIRKVNIFLNSFHLDLKRFGEYINPFELLSLTYLTQFYPEVLEEIKHTLYDCQKLNYRANITQEKQIKSIVSNISNSTSKNNFISSGKFITNLFLNLSTDELERDLIILPSRVSGSIYFSDNFNTYFYGGTEKGISFVWFSNFIKEYTKKDDMDFEATFKYLITNDLWSSFTQFFYDENRARPEIFGHERLINMINQLGNYIDKNIELKDPQIFENGFTIREKADAPEVYTWLVEFYLRSTNESADVKIRKLNTFDKFPFQERIEISAQGNDVTLFIDRYKLYEVRAHQRHQRSVGSAKHGIGWPK